MKWQPWEKDFLRLVYPDHTNNTADICLFLPNRSADSLRNQASKLGLTRHHCNSNTKFVAEIPEILTLWDFSKNWKETKSHPMYIALNDINRYWFRCEKNHSFKSIVYNIYKSIKKQNSGCSYCSNRKTCLDNCLATTHPKIAKEWHPTKNGSITPYDIVGGTNKKYWWQCQKCGHDWQIDPNHRCYGKSGCPKCKESKGEKKINQLLKLKNINFKSQYKFPNCKNKKPLPFDFAILNKQSQILGLIEFNGEQHYLDNRSRFTSNQNPKEQLEKIKLHDNIKKQFCKNNNILLLVIPYTEYDNIEQKLETFINGLNNE